VSCPINSLYFRACRKKALQKGAILREYWWYFQGSQRGGSAFSRLPQGASECRTTAKASGRVAALAKGYGH
jgi:hypothetical protein